MTTNEKVLTIIKGEEFKISVKEEIDSNDIFYDQYISAAEMLDTIVTNRDLEQSDQWYQAEFENNIIAFCGERGEGKSSAMISFVNAAYRGDKDNAKSIFVDCKNVKKTYFAEPIVIDPSMFDGVHNVLDIVLATLYRKFQDRYEEDNKCLERYQRESLLDQFQKVYRCISLINNQAKMLDDEYDYEGNIGKLSKLGESTRLRYEVKELISQYLKIMPAPQKDNKTGGCLLLAIDDLDLCSSSAYKMAEQIRKYLIVPNVAIIMAVKIEQMDLCVKEQNLNSYANIIRMEELTEDKRYGMNPNGNQIKKWESGFWDEVNGMSERYVAKLIPRARRNYLPNVQTMHNVRISYQNRDNVVLYDGKVRQTMNETILELIYEKTGMKFLTNKSGENRLLPDNLRDTVNMVVLLSDMTDPGSDEIYGENIREFCRYYEKEWLYGNLDLEDCKEIQKLISTDSLHLHEGSAYALRRFSSLIQRKYFVPNVNFLSETNDCFWSVMSWIEYFKANVFGNTEERYAYALRILYTIRLNDLIRRHKYDQFSEFLGGYLWAGNFENTISSVQENGFSRSRFAIPSIKAYYTICDYLELDISVQFKETQSSQYYIQKLSTMGTNRSSDILSLLVLGMLSNTFNVAPSGQIIYTYHVPIIFDNYVITNNLHISLENYLVSLCNLKNLYKKLNLDLMGVDLEEFNEIISSIETSNTDKIEVVRKIVANVDLLTELKEYCFRNRESKEGGKNEIETSERAVERFFRNISQIIKKYFGEEIRIDTCRIDYNGINKEISISHLYALLIQEGIQHAKGAQMNVEVILKNEELTRFADKLRERTEQEMPVESVSRYFVNKTAKNVKGNMDNLASNIRRYYSMHQEETLEEPEIMQLCDLYGRILDLYVNDPLKEISDQMNTEYRNFYKKYQRTCQP